MINQSGLPNSKILYLYGEGQTESTPLAIRRVTETNIDGHPGNKSINLAVLHPSSGVYLYAIQLDDSELFKKHGTRPIEQNLKSFRHVQIV